MREYRVSAGFLWHTAKIYGFYVDVDGTYYNVRKKPHYVIQSDGSRKLKWQDGHKYEVKRLPWEDREWKPRKHSL